MLLQYQHKRCNRDILINSSGNAEPYARQKNEGTYRGGGKATTPVTCDHGLPIRRLKTAKGTTPRSKYQVRGTRYHAKVISDEKKVTNKFQIGDINFDPVAAQLLLLHCCRSSVGTEQ